MYGDYHINGHMALSDPNDAYKMSFEEKPLNPQCFIQEDRSKGYRTYNPREVTDIFFKFCAIAQDAGGTEIGMEEAVLRWVREYGMLHDLKKELGNYAVFKNKEETSKAFIPISMEYFTLQLKNANDALHIYSNFLDPDNPDRLKWNEGNDESYDEIIIPDLNEYFDTYLKRVRPCIRHDKNKKGDSLHRLKPDWIIPDLLTAIWWQFYEIITQGRNIQWCWFCGKPFTPNVSKRPQKFCPNTRDGPRSDCANAYNVWLNRQKKKAHKIWIEARDIEAIRASIATDHPIEKGTPEKWVKEWQ